MYSVSQIAHLVAVHFCDVGKNKPNIFNDVQEWSLAHASATSFSASK